MCKKSGEFVNFSIFMHKRFTIDDNIFLATVVNGSFIQLLLSVFKKVLQCVFSLIKSLRMVYTAFPHELLLLLLSINLNIINKNLRNGVIK